MINEAEIHRKSLSQFVYEREEAGRELARDFAGLSDKVQAWNYFRIHTSSLTGCQREVDSGGCGRALVGGDRS